MRQTFFLLVLSGMALPLSMKGQVNLVFLQNFPSFDVVENTSLDFSTTAFPLQGQKTATSLTGPQKKVPKVWSYQDLSAFCKLDVQLDRIAPMNIRFRLGEVSYVDRLERKGPTRPDYRR